MIKKLKKVNLSMEGYSINNFDYFLREYCNAMSVVNSLVKEVKKLKKKLKNRNK